MKNRHIYHEVVYQNLMHAEEGQPLFKYEILDIHKSLAIFKNWKLRNY